MTDAVINEKEIKEEIKEEIKKITIVKTIVCGFYHWVDTNKNVYSYDPSGVMKPKLLGTLTSDYKIKYKPIV